MLLEAAPSIANLVLSKIPGLDLLAPHITNAVRDIVKVKLGNEDLEGLIDEEKVLEELR